MIIHLLLLLPPVLGNLTSCNEVAPDRCPSDADCSVLGMECLVCSCPTDCVYGMTSDIDCEVHPQIECSGDRKLKKTFDCRYCYQTNPSMHKCKDNFDCQSTGDPNKLFYRANCSVSDETICLGRRQFMKQKKCNWTGGYKWSTALALSITLGGFGADR